MSYERTQITLKKLTSYLGKVDVSTTKKKKKKNRKEVSECSATVVLYEDHDTDAKSSSGYLYITNEQKSG